MHPCEGTVDFSVQALHCWLDFPARTERESHILFPSATCGKTFPGTAPFAHICPVLSIVSLELRSPSARNCEEAGEWPGMTE